VGSAAALGSTLFVAGFLAHESQLHAFAGPRAHTSGLVCAHGGGGGGGGGGGSGGGGGAHAPPPSAVVARLRAKLRLRPGAQQLVGVALVAALCPVDIDLRFAPISRGSGLLLLLRVTELSFVWIGARGALILRAAPGLPALVTSVPSQVANLLADTTLAGLALLLAAHLIANHPPILGLRWSGPLLGCLVCSAVCACMAMLHWLPPCIHRMCLLASADVAAAGDATAQTDADLSRAGDAGLLWLLAGWTLAMVPLAVRVLIFSLHQHTQRQAAL
jgi:hypothetical protein